jgi:hypothetical protein
MTNAKNHPLGHFDNKALLDLHTVNTGMSLRHTGMAFYPGEVPVCFQPN